MKITKALKMFHYVVLVANDEIEDIYQKEFDVPKSRRVPKLVAQEQLSEHETLIRIISQKEVSITYEMPVELFIKTATKKSIKEKEKKSCTNQK
nr:MAG TPA: hypothetical protein [Caudoviricetes sp.]